MVHFRDEIRIEASVDHVWAFLCDTTHWRDWQTRSEFTDFSGPIDQVGTTFVERGKLLGFEMTDTDRIVEVEPQRLIRLQSERFPSDMYFRFQPEGEATHLVIEGDYEMPGHLPEFIQKVMTKSWMERNMRHMLEDFKVLAEAKIPVPA
jgi:ligand-binding SRPBCC domain-containing protein